MELSQSEGSEDCVETALMMQYNGFFSNIIFLCIFLLCSVMPSCSGILLYSKLCQQNPRTNTDATDL